MVIGCPSYLGWHRATAWSSTARTGCATAPKSTWVIPRVDRRARPQPRIHLARRDESLTPLYPSAGCDFAAHAGDPVVWGGLVPIPAAGGAAGGRLSDHP